MGKSPTVRAATAIAAGVLAPIGVVAAIARGSDGTENVVRAAAPDTGVVVTTEAPPMTAAPTTTEVPTTTSIPPATAPPTTVSRATTTTVRRAVSTTVPRPTFAIAPSPAPANAMATASGSGCNGATRGINVSLRGPGASDPPSDPPRAMTAG